MSRMSLLWLVLISGGLLVGGDAARGRRLSGQEMVPMPMQGLAVPTPDPRIDEARELRAIQQSLAAEKKLRDELDALDAASAESERLLNILRERVSLVRRPPKPVAQARATTAAHPRPTVTPKRSTAGLLDETLRWMKTRYWKDEK